MDLRERLSAQFRVEFVGQVVVAGSGALLTFVLARLLNPDGYGLLYLAISVFSVFGLGSQLGLPNSTTRYIAEYREKAPGQLPYILRTSVGYITVSTLLVSVLLVGTHSLIADWLDNEALVPLLLVGVCFVVAKTFQMYSRTALQGFEDIKTASAVQAVGSAGRLVFSVGFVLLGYGALGALGGFILGLSLAALLGMGRLFVHYYRGSERAPSVESGLRRRIFEYNLPLIVTSSAGTLDKQVDTLLVGFFLNPVSVSYYVLSKQVVTFVQVPAKALGFSVSPTYGTKKASDDLEPAAQLFETSVQHTLLVYLPAAAGIALVASPGIELVFGTEYAGAAPVLQVLALYAVLDALTKILDRPLDYLGRAKYRAVYKSVASVSNFGLNLLLIPALGVVGAAIATVITHTFYVAGKLYLVAEELPLDGRRLVIQTGQALAITAAMAAVVFVLLPLVSGLPTLIGAVLAGVATWGVLAVGTDAIDRDPFE